MRVVRCLVGLVFLLFCFSSWSQQKRLDSLLQVHQSYKTKDSIKIIQYRNIFRQYGNMQRFDLAVLYIDSAANLARQLKLNYALWDVYERAGRLHHGRSRYAEALGYYQQAYDVSLGMNSIRHQAGILLNMGALYLDLKDYVKSLEKHQASLMLFEQVNNLDGINSSIMNIGLIYLDLNQIEKALLYMKRALTAFEKDDPEGRGIAVAQQAIALAYMRASDAELKKMGIGSNERYMLALAGLNKALPIAFKEDDQGLASNILADMGDIYDRMGDATKAISVLKRAMDIDVSHEEYIVTAENFYKTGLHYVKWKDDQTGLKYFRSAIIVAEKHHALGALKQVYEQMSYLYERMGSFDSSLIFFRKHIVIRDSLYGEEKEKEITRQQLRIDLDIKDRDFRYSKQLLDNELKQQVLLAARRKDQLELAEKEKSVQRLLFLQEQSKLENEARQQSIVFQQQQDRSRFEKAIAQKQINNQHLQLQYNRNLNFFFMAVVFILLGAGGIIYYNQRKTKKLNTIINKHKKELEELVTVKDQVLGTLSHDMRTPINSLISFTHLLEKDTIPQDKMKLYAAQLKSTLGYTQGLMDNLLKWATSQMHGFAPNIETVDLAEIMEDAILSAADTIHQKELIIQNKITKGALLLADREMLASVVRNLLANAIKFSHKTGTIELNSVMTGEYRNFIITDKGIGMDANKILLINDTVNHSVKSSKGTGQEKGNGLGLLLCKSFVTMMNGRLEVSSQLQHGTSFTVQLPKHTATS
jgi:signal transduction histidine kinase